MNEGAKTIEADFELAVFKSGGIAVRACIQTHTHIGLLERRVFVRIRC